MEPNFDTLILPHPAAIVPRARAEIRAAAIANGAVDEAALDGEEPFFWSAEISNNRLDSHYTTMAISSLKNYADDAQAGVSFLYSHDNSEIIGRSLAGQFVNAQGNGVARVLADFFAVPGLQLGTVSSDQVIRAIRLGIIKDVSIGFYGGELICSICGRDIFRDWECRHYPGFKYEVEGDGKTREEMCTADVENARLAETSGVYKASTPGAVVIKAQRDAEAGRLKPEARQLIEQRYRIHLPSKSVSSPGIGERRMSTKREAEENPNPPAADPPLANEPEAPTNPPETPTSVEQPTPIAPPEAQAEERAVRFAAAEFARANLKDAPSNLRELTALALDGRRYREDLINEALKEGVRANGASFQRDTYEAILRRSSIDEIKTFAADWGAKSSALFPGGRATTDGTDLPDEPEGKRETSIPPAYAGAYSAS